MTGNLGKVLGQAVGDKGRTAEAQEAAAVMSLAVPDSKPRIFNEMALLWLLAASSLMLHLATAGRCELYIDEIYGVLSSRHSPACSAEIFPLQLWLTWLSTTALGTSRFAVRFLPAIAGSANIVVAGLFARELGGKRFSVALAGLGVFVSPILMFAAGSTYAWSYEGVLWSLSALLVVRALRAGNGQWWLPVGIVWGLGLLNKPTMLLFMMGVGFGLLATRARVELFRRGYWIALLAAFILSSPVWVWQAGHGWPIFGVIGAMSSDEFADSGFWLAYFSRSKMLLAQPAFLGPLNFILAVGGALYGFLFCRETAARVFTWAWMAAAFAFVVTSGHPSYLNPVYAMSSAFGCVVLERITTGRRFRWGRPVLMAGLVAQGLVITPLCVPILPNELLNAYARFSCRGILLPLSSTASILQDSEESMCKVNSFVYRAWAMKLYRAHRALPVEERKSCCIIVGHAPVAEGVEFHAVEYDLPKIFSPHLNYAFWGPPDEGARTVLAVFFSREELERWFGRVENANNFGDIYICRDSKCTYRQMWEEMCGLDASFRWMK